MRTAVHSGRAALTRRAAVQALAAVALSWRASGSEAATLPAPGSLPSALAAALQRRQPLVVLASTQRCAFCRIVRDNYLVPLQRENQLPVIELDLGGRDGLVDFAGAPSTPADVLRRWRVDIAPTVLFLGPGGREVAPRLVGLPADFYSAYLEQRLATARRALGRKSA